MFIGARITSRQRCDGRLAAVFPRHGHGRLLTIPMFFGAELVKVTPMDFLRDTLLWAKLMDKYKGTMTAAPNFAYALLAKRLRRQAKGRRLRSVHPAVRALRCRTRRACGRRGPAGRPAKPFGLRSSAILPAYGMAETTLAVSFSGATPDWSSTRSMPTCWLQSAVRSPRRRATPSACDARTAADGPGSPHRR